MMRDCNTCKYKDAWGYAEPCSSCTNVGHDPDNWSPQTNADRIRAMSDEELARFIVRKNQCPDGYTSVFGPHCVEDNGCEECWLEWLKKEADNDKPEYDCWYVNGSSYPAECVKVVEDETKEVRTRHGRWERVGNFDKWICSRCKSENLYAYSYGDDDYELQDFFCPHCGANMDGSDKNA